MDIISNTQKLEELYKQIESYIRCFDDIDSLYDEIKNNSRAIELEVIPIQDKGVTKCGELIQIALNWRFEKDQWRDNDSMVSRPFPFFDYKEDDYESFLMSEILEDGCIRDRERLGHSFTMINYDTYEYPFAIKELHIDNIKDQNNKVLFACIYIRYSNTTFNIKTHVPQRLLFEYIDTLELIKGGEDKINSLDIWPERGGVEPWRDIVECTMECFPTVLSNIIKQLDDISFSNIDILVGDCIVTLYRYKMYATVAGMIDGFKFKRYCELKENSILNIVSRFYERQHSLI